MSASPLERNAVLNSNPTSASGNTPFKPKSGSFPPVKENEIAKTSIEVLKEEIKDLCVTVKYSTFYDAFLKDKAHEPSEKDLEGCLDRLRSIEDAYCRYSDSPWASTSTKGVKTKPEPESGFLKIKNSSKEAGLYSVQSKLLTTIGDYVRLKQGDSIDAEWPQAKNPLSQDLQLSTGTHITSNPLPTIPLLSPDVLHRQFVFCPSKITRPVQKEDNPAELKLDMAMIITKPGIKIDYDTSLADQPQFYWKDVMLPIEAQLKSIFNADVASQVASYVRMVRVEQPDRNFVYALTINRSECRVWRWDVSACYVSEALNLHDSPLEFIRLIWRLHTMTPEDFGFDNHFSNAGRVLAGEVDTMPTTLTIKGFTPNTTANPHSNQDGIRHGGGIGQTGRGAGGAKEEIYVLEEKLFQSHGLFSRNPVVWKAQVLDKRMERGATVVIKQNWQDITRESEASYYDQANAIPGIAHLRAFQELDQTKEWWVRLPQEDVALRAFTASQPGSSQRSTSASTSRHSSGHSPSVNRVLIRMVFTGVGASLIKAHDSQELLAAMLDVVKAMERLYELNIMHRDISTGNILLNEEPEPAVGNRGFLIDFGLAQRLAHPPEVHSISTQVNTHNHRTGTLPFMAVDLLDDNPFTEIIHEIHHDLESIFWVLLYVCLKGAGIDAIHKPNTVTSWWIQKQITKLESSRPSDLRRVKVDILTDSGSFLFQGKFVPLLPTAKTFADMCFMSLTRNLHKAGARRLDFGIVKELLQNGLLGLSQTPPVSSPNSPKRTLESADLTVDEGQADGSGSAAPTHCVKRSRMDLQ